MPRVFIGRTHDLYGKSLWELLCNLKDLGVGRVVKRTKFNRRYPEPSWYRILSVRPEMDPENRRGTVTARRVFRGVETPEDVTLSRTTALTDYQLVPRHEEAAFCRLSPERLQQAVRTLPAALPKPPLLLELERLEAADTSSDMPAVYTKQWNYRIEGQPTGGSAPAGAAAS